MFKNKTLLITGGTGSFGNCVLDRFLYTEIHEIRIFSRDETKQDMMRHRYQSEKIKYYVGDVRDYNSIYRAMNGVDYVFHAAALKHVPPCEFFPMEAVKTNIIGADNVLNAAIEADVRKVICLSTDKAAYPVNAMGMTKAVMEKVFVARSQTVDKDKTLICGTRYGNVLYSRGSVVPLFISQIKEKKPITVTNPDMTRFVMSLQEAMDLVIFAFHNAQAGDLMVQKADSCRIGDLAQAVKELFDADSEIKIIGARHGEKLYEELMTPEEAVKAIDMGNFYRIPADGRGLNYENYIDLGFVENNDNLVGYNSSNSKKLTVSEIKEKLLKIHEIRKELGLES